ncbi:TlpA disulfide reductase family protein [Actinotalea sp. C106]|uniref:TlpA family protein disulfide reductase n=1 Tax=Actinotalea sp. C106 TaxID=2908644 RepID=UPI00202908DF|nr:TlpA disulfide reductase family protein [Actinotalea sp. C106]
MTVRFAAAVGAGVLALTLTACSSGVGGGWTEGGAQAGYVSGDSSVTTWDVGDRTGPVEVTGTAYDGQEISVADWRGDVVVLNTWYAECPPCRAEAPDLVELADDYADRGVRLLGINSTDAAGAAQSFERTFDVPYPSLEDTRGAAVAALQGTVPIQAVPTTVVLDREGNVYARVLGQADGSTLRALVDDALAEQAGSA